MTVNNKIGIFSFFSGLGVLDYGFETTKPFQIIYANEYYKPFVCGYKYSRKKLGIKEPICGIDCDSIEILNTPKGKERLKRIRSENSANFDMIGFIGGPPCPDFSVGGKNRGQHGENGKLSSSYVNLICSVSPDFFLFENVKGLYRTAKHREFFEAIKRKLSKAGYNLTERLINSLEYGVPQDRERIIMIGFKKELIDVKDDQNWFPWNSTIKYNTADLKNIPWPQRDPFVENGDMSLPKGIIRELTVDYWFKKNKTEKHPNSSHYFKPRQGLAKFEVIDEGDDSKKSYKRLHRFRYSPTAAYGNNEVHLHPYHARRLTVAEALAIQSLPEQFQLPEEMTLTDMFKTVGNAVPYLAAKGIAEAMEKFIEEKVMKC